MKQPELVPLTSPIFNKYIESLVMPMTSSNLKLIFFRLPVIPIALGIELKAPKKSARVSWADYGAQDTL